MRTITQRQLRNDSGAVLREVQAGEHLTVTRNGTPVAELAAGPYAVVDEQDRGRRQDRLQWVASRWDPAPT